MIVLLKAFAWFRGSLITQILVGVVAFGGIWKINNLHQQKVGQAKLIEKSNVEAKRRNVKVRKVRRNIRRGGAHKRLLKDFTKSSAN